MISASGGREKQTANMAAKRNNGIGVRKKAAPG